jgi:hypothetical protein
MYQSTYTIKKDTVTYKTSLTINDTVRFEVLTATNMRMTVFWDVAQCCLVEVH